MELPCRLLDHPFYRAWTMGTITRDQLAAYHRSYAEFIREIPVFWQSVTDELGGRTPEAAAIVAEETAHIALWEEWGKSLPPPAAVPGMEDVREIFRAMTPSQLLGALHAFEIQQPEVARTKKEGLVRCYGFEAGQLLYFDEHEREEAHIAYGRTLAAAHARMEEFNEGFARGAEAVYRSLDKFVVS